MATTLFKDITCSVFGLIEEIKNGEVALPDILRPFPGRLPAVPGDGCRGARQIG
jgi:hypothetical protein